jgi:hypothetical protein
LNLIRVIPAKGQDNAVKPSTFLAKLTGPAALAAAVSRLRQRFQAGAIR